MSTCVVLSAMQAADSLASRRPDLYSPGIAPRRLLRAARRCSISKPCEVLLCFPASPTPPTSRISRSRLWRLVLSTKAFSSAVGFRKVLKNCQETVFWIEHTELDVGVSEECG